MCIVPDNYEALDRKGVASHILQRDLDGYWDKVITVHPFCKQERTIQLSDRHIVMEYERYDIIGTIAKLNLLAKREDVIAIKAHDPYFTGPLGLILSRTRAIPYVIMICSSYDLARKEYGHAQLRFDWLDRVVARTTLSRADAVFGGSGDARLWALRNGAKQATLVRTGGIADCHFVLPEGRPKWQGEAEGKIVLFVGLDAIKFPEDAILAYEVIRLSHPDSMLVMAGDGPLREQLVREYGQREDVKFLGFVDPPSLASLMATSSVALVPLGGSALVELALAETPIVAYDIDWHRELIHDGSGVLVPLRDRVSMAKEASKLLADKGRAEAMGKKARQTALAQHSLEVVQEKERQCFDEVLSKRRSGNAHSTGKS
jgi:glycosyltransferase involved in cell wall biosynthesis